MSQRALSSEQFDAGKCCDDPTPLDTKKRVGAVKKWITQCDNCGAEMTTEQTQAAHGLRP